MFDCYWNRQKELSLTFKNWSCDDVILELSRHIENGYHICSYCHNMSCGETEIEVTLIATRD